MSLFCSFDLGPFLSDAIPIGYQSFNSQMFLSADQFQDWETRTC
jgi:hypothetical protein